MSNFWRTIWKRSDGPLVLMKEEVVPEPTPLENLVALLEKTLFRVGKLSYKRLGDVGLPYRFKVGDVDFELVTRRNHHISIVADYKLFVSLNAATCDEAQPLVRMRLYEHGHKDGKAVLQFWDVNNVNDERLTKLAMVGLTQLHLNMEALRTKERLDAEHLERIDAHVEEERLATTDKLLDRMISGLDS